MALEAAGRHGVPVFNAPFSNTRSVAELVLAEVIALARRLADRSREMHEGRWRKGAASSHEVRGKTLAPAIGYLVMDLNREVSKEVRARMSALETSIRTRVLY